SDLKPGSYVVISCSDTGVGIPKENLGRIFEAFFTTKETSGGTGLGLATALSIVKGHSGALLVSSEPDKGTQFDLYLPALPSRAPSEPRIQKGNVPHGRNQLILIVDDEAPTREIVTATLSSYGYRVLAACNGAEALSLFEGHGSEIALVLTDIAM